MTRQLYEVDRVTGHSTGYIVNVHSASCLEKNTYIKTHKILGSKFTDNKNYKYVSNLDIPSSCANITNEDMLYNCLSSCNTLKGTSKYCGISLEYNTATNNKIILTNKYDYTKFSNLDVNITTIKPVNNLSTFNQGLSSEQYVTLELSGTMIYFKSLNISNVNLHAHDSNNRAITVDTSLTITNGNHMFTNNTINDKGGAIYSNNSINFTDASITFSGNASKDGGAIYSNNSINFTDASITFDNNVASKYGGAIFANTINSNNGNFVFQYNTALDEGGAITFSKLLNIQNGNYRFSSNTSNVGGAITNIEYGNIHFIDSSMQFNNNTSKFDGGAIKAYYLYCSSSNILFDNNVVTRINGTGGAIAAYNLTISSGIYWFRNNTVELGAVVEVLNKFIIADSNNLLELDFTDNFSNGSILLFDTFDSSLACPHNSSYNSLTGCNNTYNFYNNQSFINLIDFKSKFFIAGGKWNFSNNTFNTFKNTTAIYGNDPNNSIISIRHADISFDPSLLIITCSADVSKSTTKNNYNYYSINRTTKFEGLAANKINTNRGNP